MIMSECSKYIILHKWYILECSIFLSKFIWISDFVYNMCCTNNVYISNVCSYKYVFNNAKTLAKYLAQWYIKYMIHVLCNMSWQTHIPYQQSCKLKYNRDF